MIEKAGRAVPANVARSVAEVLREPLPASRYDAIVSITVCTTWPVDRRCPLAAALRPGEVLAVVALPGVICSSCPPNSRRRPAGLLALLAALAEAG
jgi:hypothetical protein